MAHTYTQLLTHLVFAVSGRENVIPEFFRPDLQRYITGFAKNKGVRLLSVYCNPDHTHLLIGYKPDLVLSDFVKNLKVATNKFVNENLVLSGKFSWQSGYGAFSCSPGNTDKVIHYILNQAEHHRNVPFRTEYKKMLDGAKIPYEDDYIFD